MGLVKYCITMAMEYRVHNAETDEESDIDENDEPNRPQ